MSSRTLLLLVAVAALSPLRGGPDGGADPCARPTADCSGCHATIHGEWRDSRHAVAWRDPVYRDALKGLEHPERCHGCHAPEPVLSRLGRPPRARLADRDGGVGCTACHDARGRIAGPFGAPTDAHESELDPAFSTEGSLHLCASCHDLRIGPVMPLGRDFRDAGLAERGKSCVGCHMPRARRPVAEDPVRGPGPEREGRSHALRGPSDPDFCATAFKLGISRDAGRVELAVGNRAGHRVPGLTTRSFGFAVTQRDAGGVELRRDRIEISTENPLWVAETRRFRFALAAGAVMVDVRVSHRYGAAENEIAVEQASL